MTTTIKQLTILLVYVCSTQERMNKMRESVPKLMLMLSGDGQ